MTECQRIGQVAVVPNGKAAGVEVGEQRLHVAQDDVAGGGIAVVADGHAPFQALDDACLAEVVADETQAAFLIEAGAVIGDDAAAFLATMLKGVHAKCGDRGGVVMAKDAKDPAFLAEPVVMPIRVIHLQRVGVVLGHLLQHHRCGSIAAG
jgi:hypothetical protein